MLIGVDASTSHVGLSLLDRRGALRALCAINGQGVEGAVGVSALVVRQIEHWQRIHQFRFDELAAVIERAPPTARKDVGHGKQAAIGFALGFAAGAIAARLSMQGCSWSLIDVGSWRQDMLARSTALGVPAEAPDRPRPPGSATAIAHIERAGPCMLLVRWSCGHSREMSLEALQAGAVCTECAGYAVKVDPGDAWKELACKLVCAHWPHLYALLVADARARAKEKDKPDHRLSGVSDACESVWIGATGLPPVVPGAY